MVPTAMADHKASAGEIIFYNNLQMQPENNI